MLTHQNSDYEGLEVYYGDLHNHCGLSYGNGSFEDAIYNARLQLDFVSVTLHAFWPDMPVADKKLDYLVEYHRKGFAKAVQNWKKYLQKVDKENQSGQFLVFPSYEWHSNYYGDHCVYYKSGVDQPMLDSPDLTSLHAQLDQLSLDAFIIPHHVGYKQGYRGINWAEFTENRSPVVESFSFHGSSESSESAYPYLHTMGPRHEQSCIQYGWSQGNIFGVIGSTDHHNAFPGSYGFGRLGVWSKSLTREAVWESIKKRRTYALTGDKIELRFSMNGYLMGDICPPDDQREIFVSVTGGDSIDCIDVLHNNQVIHRACPIYHQNNEQIYKINIELGWGENPEATNWDVNLNLLHGKILQTEPRFRGFGSQGVPEGKTYAYTHWQQIDDNHVHFRTRTRPNPSLHTPATEGMSIEIQGECSTELLLNINGHEYRHPLNEILTGSRTHYLEGFVSPAICIHRAIPRTEYQHQFSFVHTHQASQRDWYYVRVRQANNQWAWSSPIWIENS